MKESKFQFTNPKLDKIIFNINEEYTEKIDNKLSYSMKVERQGIDNNNAIVKLIIEIGNNENSRFYLNLEISAKFKWNDIDDEQIDSFLEVNAPALLLSYARPIVANITMQAGLSPMNLPFMNFVK